jgi:hypothetical protein
MGLLVCDKIEEGNHHYVIMERNKQILIKDLGKYEERRKYYKIKYYVG